MNRDPLSLPSLPSRPPLPSWLPLLSRALWWVLRVLAVLTLGLLLRWHVYPGVAVTLPALFAVVLYLLRGPDDQPRRKLHQHAALVVAGDLLTVAVLFCSTLLVLRGQSLLVLVALAIVLPGAVSLRWGLPSGPREADGSEGVQEPGPRVRRSPRPGPLDLSPRDDAGGERTLRSGPAAPPGDGGLLLDTHRPGCRRMVGGQPRGPDPTHSSRRSARGAN